MQTEKAKSSHFDRTRGLKNQIFPTLGTWDIDLIEILKIMPQMWQYVIFLSLKPTKVTSDFILY